MSDQYLKDLNEATQELRRTNDAMEAKTAVLAEAKEKIEKLEKKLDELEDINEKTVAAKLDVQRKELEMKERIDTLEAQVIRGGNGTEAAKVASQDMKFFEKMIREGKEMAITEFGLDMGKKYLRTDSNIDGGFLVPVEYFNEILKKITEISPIRQISRQRQISGGSLKVPVRNVLMTAYWEGEGQTGTASNSQYGQEELFPGKLTGITEISIEEMQDAMFNMESELTQDMSEQFARTEGASFVTGNGIKKPYGFTTNSLVQIWNSGFTNAITWDALVDVTGQLKTGYNPVWVMNRRTLAYIRKLKDGVGRYIWEPAMAAGQPNMIEGYPYVSAIDMADVDTGTIPVAFGDFLRGYLIVDKTQIIMVRDQYTKIDQGLVRFIMHKRVGGQVVLPEAIKLLKCSTSSNTNQ